MNKIEVITKDAEGYTNPGERDFDTMKEARAFVKECALDASYHDRCAESEGWAKRIVHTVQLLKNGECVQDWFPEFK